MSSEGTKVPRLSLVFHAVGAGGELGACGSGRVPRVAPWGPACFCARHMTWAVHGENASCGRLGAACSCWRVASAPLGTCAASCLLGIKNIQNQSHLPKNKNQKNSPRQIHALGDGRAIRTFAKTGLGKAGGLLRDLGDTMVCSPYKLTAQA